ncbi:MAG: hypothetical protein GY711_15710 [bacterium]|nr:hypothetical protein [bacterium]
MRTIQQAKKTLPQPKLQLWLVGSFVGLSVLAMLLMILILGFQLGRAGSQLQASSAWMAALPGLMARILVFSVLVLLPIIFACSVALTRRIAGPVTRFEEFLHAVARGEQVTPCQLREGDPLGSLCDAINEATEPLRDAASSRRRDTGETSRRRAA